MRPRPQKKLLINKSGSVEKPLLEIHTVCIVAGNITESSGGGAIRKNGRAYIVKNRLRK